METTPFPGCAAQPNVNDPYNLGNVHHGHVGHSANYLALEQPTYATLSASSHGSPQKLTGKSLVFCIGERITRSERTYKNNLIMRTRGRWND